MSKIKELQERVDILAARLDITSIDLTESRKQISELKKSYEYKMKLLLKIINGGKDV